MTPDPIHRWAPMYAIEVDGEVTPVDGLDSAIASGVFAQARWRLRTNVGPVVVSTVFLGLNATPWGVPLWFETMVFGESDGWDQARWATMDAARVGHADAVAATAARLQVDPGETVEDRITPLSGP